MRVLLTILILIFGLQSWTKAEDIREFEIEGMSIGDSLLDYYSKKEIISFTQKRQYPKSQRIKITKIKLDNFDTYEVVSADFLDDGSYKIVKLSGRMFFENDIDNCYKKMLEIDEDLKKNFSIENRYSGDKKHRYDKTGKSTLKVIGYTLGKDDIQIQCTDWSDTIDLMDSLSVMLFTEEWMNFLDDEAYKE